MQYEHKGNPLKTCLASVAGQMRPVWRCRAVQAGPAVKGKRKLPLVASLNDCGGSSRASRQREARAFLCLCKSFNWRISDGGGGKGNDVFAFDRSNGKPAFRV